MDNLKHRNKKVRSDCIKVLYEIGEIKPKLIEVYVEEFVEQLSSKDNRLVWGSMTALGCIVSLRADEIWERVNTIMETTQNGSVITQDWGIRVLASVSAEKQEYAQKIFPFLMQFLSDCRPKDVPRHAESILVAANSLQYEELLRLTLETHIPQLKPSQLKRVEKILGQLDD